MNDNHNKQRCDVCGFTVRLEGHESRCMPARFSDRVWSDTRVLAWLGDSVQRMDVKLALLFMGVPGAELGSRLEQYTSNASMAEYVRSLGLIGRSDHTSGTSFEAHYTGEFRVRWLRETFPDVAERVLLAWVPPAPFPGFQVDASLKLILPQV